jgi:hypothetical protein
VLWERFGENICSSLRSQGAQIRAHILVGIQVPSFCHWVNFPQGMANPAQSPRTPLYFPFCSLPLLGPDPPSTLLSNLLHKKYPATWGGGGGAAVVLMCGHFPENARSQECQCAKLRVLSLPVALSSVSCPTVHWLLDSFRIQAEPGEPQQCSCRLPFPFLP